MNPEEQPVAESESPSFNFFTDAERECEKAQAVWKKQVGFTRGVKCCGSCRWCRENIGDGLCLYPSVPHIEDQLADMWVNAADVCDLWRGWPDDDEDNSPIVRDA